MRKFTLNHRGFTFIETMVTFSVVGILLLLTWGTVQFLLMQSNEQIVRTRAHFLAIEGIEIVKQIRQTAVNRNRETGFLDTIGKKQGHFILETMEGGFLMKPGSNEIISMTEEPYIDYCRTVEISGESSEPKKLTSTVTWGDPECKQTDHLIRYSTYLADLKK